MLNFGEKHKKSATNAATGWSPPPGVNIETYLMMTRSVPFGSGQNANAANVTTHQLEKIALVIT